jgi:hypothetical protein
MPWPSQRWGERRGQWIELAALRGTVSFVQAQGALRARRNMGSPRASIEDAACFVKWEMDGCSSPKRTRPNPSPRRAQGRTWRASGPRSPSGAKTNAGACLGGEPQSGLAAEPPGARFRRGWGWGVPGRSQRRSRMPGARQTCYTSRSSDTLLRQRQCLWTAQRAARGKHDVSEAEHGRFPDLSHQGVHQL